MLKGSLKSEFVKNVSVLFTGAVLAQIISYSLEPIISRYYLPSDRAELSMFTYLASFGAALGTAKFELALPVIKGIQNAFRVYLFSLRILVIFVLLSLVIIIIPAVLENKLSDGVFYLLIPVGILILGLTNLSSNWAITQKQFPRITRGKIGGSAINNVTKLVSGFAGVGYLGLLFGYLLGGLVNTVVLMTNFRKDIKIYKVKPVSKRSKYLAYQNKNFPFVTLPHTLMDYAREIIIGIMMWNFFSQSEYGSYSYAITMLKLPLMLLGSAIAQVFFQRCSEKFKNQEKLMPIAVKSVLALLGLSILPMVVILLFGEEIFAFVFSENYRVAGQFSEIMAPWVIFMFVTSPISNLPMIIGKQRPFFVLAFIGAFMMLLGIYLPSEVFNMSVENTLYVLTYSQLLFLLVVLAAILWMVKRSDEKITNELAK